MRCDQEWCLPGAPDRAGHTICATNPSADPQAGVAHSCSLDLTGTKRMFGRPTASRVYFIQSKRWIAYPKAVHILDHLNKLLKHPRTTRMPSLIVYGDSGMGKSMLVDKFKADCAAGCATDSTPNPNKVLVVELSGRPTERRLFSQILAAVDAPHSPRASIVDVERGAINTLRDIGVQILVLDEIHNILAGSWREQRIVLNTLRFLSNELKLSLVCFGIMEARDAINGDVQLARRFDAVTLPRWTAGKEFEQLVLAIVRNLPLREPSVLTVKGLRRVLQMSGGVSSRIFRMLNDLAIEAIEKGEERITDNAVETYKPVSENEVAFQ
jgi:Bacterial TniB protein